VLRHGIGDEVHVFNGRDGEWSCMIDTIAGRAVTLRAGTQRRVQLATASDLTLAFSPLKKTRTDFTVEKATELGVSIIQPVITARTQTTRVRADRLQKIALEAAEQTERLDLPIVEEPLTLDALLDGLGDQDALYFCDEAGDDSEEKWGGETGRALPFRHVLETARPGAAIILIGPEGGFTPEERAQLRARENVKPVTLGKNILRAETAAISALTLYQAMLGDWSLRPYLDMTARAGDSSHDDTHN
jgi:16S rRNA (uracil1498-N3)-methyltransferase